MILSVAMLLAWLGKRHGREELVHAARAIDGSVDAVLEDPGSRTADLQGPMGCQAFASRYAGSYVVTLSVDQVMFRQPVHMGERVTFLAAVNHTGTSSMEVGIKVVAQEIRSRQVRHVNSCFFTRVAVDDDRKPVPVPPLRPFTPDEKRRHAAAIVRKELRQAFQRRASGGSDDVGQGRAAQ